MIITDLILMLLIIMLIVIEIFITAGLIHSQLPGAAVMMIMTIRADVIKIYKSITVLDSKTRSKIATRDG